MKVTITVEDATVVDTKSDGKAQDKKKEAPKAPAENPAGVTVHITPAVGEPRVVPVPEPLATILKSLLD